MNTPSDALDGSPSFTLATRPLADGRVEAYVVSHPDIAAVGEDAVMAFQLVQTKLQDRLLAGFSTMMVR